ncbi:MAG: hypothetical protein ACPGKS_02305 [Coraliomargarita sp.]
MKALPLIALALPVLLLAAEPQIQVGSTEDEVLKVLGKPIGNVQLRDRVLWLYPQGELTIEDHQVTDIDLMADDEFAEHQKQLELEREAWQAQQAQLKAERISEGEAVKRDKLKSSSFAALPAKDRVDYWRTFQARYPEVDVSEEIGAALASFQTEMKELETHERIAALEARLAQAEKETAAARLEAEKLRKEAEALRQQKNYGLRYYTDPVPVYRNYYYRPPTVIINDGKVSVPPYYKRH